MLLSHRIHLTLLGAVILAIGAFAGLVLATSHRLEHALLDTLLRSEAAMLVENLREDPQAQLPQLGTTAAWLSDRAAPEVFRQLPPDIAHDVVFQGERHHVLRQPLDQGMLTVAVNIEALEQRETALQVTVIAGGIIIVLLVLGVARTISLRVAAPLQQLAAELDRLDPKTSEPTALAERYRGGEVHIIAAALDRYIERLAELVARERSFASSASHELRSPVTVIRSSLELMQLDRQLPDSLRGAVERAHRSAGQLSQVLDGLMLLARDSVADEVAAVDAKEIAGDLIEELRLEYPTLELRWQAPAEPVPVLASEAHLRMLLGNLIRNARDHAPGKLVTVAMDRNGLTVDDQGPGIDQALLPHIFDRCQRSASSLGAGLGLYIAAEICRRHGCSIAAENLQPAGCRISVAFGKGAAPGQSQP